ncbi:MAG: squalene--hopene cyclase, partial [Pseudomonadota bacterium]|nr:squalene--hopene cyclase [Pseudomonadota bacterium]
MQREDGHWVFELEADATIPAEYVLLTHFLGEPDPALEQRIAVYLRRVRMAGGGWPLHHAGVFNISASVKAYFALKAIGDSPDAPHMREAREAILGNGGAEEANVFTRILLALFGAMPWRSVPVTPVEIMFLPRHFPIHLSRISYWGRTVVVPLLVLHALKPLARNPRGVGIAELFVSPPRDAKPPRRAGHQSQVWWSFFALVDAVLRHAEPLFPTALRRRAIDRAVAFVRERLNGDSGLGAIFPAMANTVMMFDALGYRRDHPEYATARKAIDLLLVARSDETYCQPCVSPVWDTALVCHALLEVGDDEAVARVGRGLDWLKPRQVLDVYGDWAIQRPGVRPGGWAFQYENPHYPDLDDTAAVVLAMDRYARLPRGRSGNADFEEAIERGREWVLALQSKNGGWGAFDADNDKEYLNHVPFADHGALLDPPTEDVTARCIGMLSLLRRDGDEAALQRGLRFLRNQQRADGSWYGRWGMNYIYGTWSVLCGLRAAGVRVGSAEIQRAAQWLHSIQNDDGGWGEHESSYGLDDDGHQPAPSTASQTAWAVLALLAAGEVESDSVRRGIAWLVEMQQADGFWHEPEFTATGFPRVFYLRYHGYPKFFPLWALARYRRLTASPAHEETFG